MGYRAKPTGNLDANHVAIKRAAQRVGSVIDISGAAYGFDLLVSREPGKTIAVEVKPEDGMYSLGQLEVIATWQGYVALVSTEDRMIHVMSEPSTYCLSKKDQNKILGFVARRKRETQVKDWKKAKVRVGVIEKLLK